VDLFIYNNCDQLLASYSNKMKKKKIRQVLKSNTKIVEIDKTVTPNTHIHGRSLSCIGTYTSIQSDRAQTSRLCEMRQTCKCFPHASNMQILTFSRANKLLKDEVLLTVGSPIFPPILIAKYLFTGS
jgi:hypothetical protein